MQTVEYLEALGIVQYRRRKLHIPEPGPSSTDRPTENKIADGTPGPVETVKREVVVTPADEIHREPVNAVVDTPVSDQQIHFDLLIWKTDKLLVWEFSQGQTGLSSAKHRLVNNVLKALWPSEFQGVQVLQQSWPIPGENSSKARASNWLKDMLSGSLQSGASVPVWLMGDVGLELIIDGFNSDEDFQGSRIKHPQLGIDLFVGPALQSMFENPIAKARTWQMLRELRNS